jgi:transcriptional regulator with XRE-family HTH domain
MKRHCLERRRKELGMSQQEVADAAGIGRSTYTRIENGTRNPSWPVMYKIAEVLKAEVTIFFERDVPLGNEKAS